MNERETLKEKWEKTDKKLVFAFIAGIAAINIAEKRAVRKLQKENDEFWSNINRPEDRWVKAKVRDVK